MRHSPLLLAPALAAALLFGCSGSVEIADPRGAAESASHAGDLCSELCAIPSCDAAEDDCHAACEAFYHPGCTPQTDAMLECAIDVVTTKCELEGDMCAAERAAHDACPN